MRATLVGIAMALALAGCREEVPPPEPVREPAGTPRTVTVDPSLIESGRVRVVEVARKIPADAFEAPGRVAAAPAGDARVSAALAGGVREVLVREGDRVKKGQKLAALDAPDVARIEGEIAQAMAARREAQQILQQEEALATRRATSERAVIAARRDEAQARAAEIAARRQLQAYRGQADVIASPIDGVVAHRAISIGERVAPGQLLFHVVAEDALEVVAELPVAGARRVERGATASLVVTGSDERCEARVVAVGAAVEAANQRVMVRLAPSAGCGTLIYDAYVEVIIAGTEGASARVVVPREAVTEVEGVTVVFVPKGAPGTFIARPVQVFRYGPQWVYLDGGLEAGERIADRGVILLKGEWMRGALE